MPLLKRLIKGIATVLILLIVSAVYQYSIHIKVGLPIPVAGNMLKEIHEDTKTTQLHGGYTLTEIHKDTMSPLGRKMLKAECKLPGFRTREQCQRINMLNQGNNCSYNCNCYNYRTNALPVEYSEPLLLPKQDMVNIEAITLYDSEFQHIMDSPSAERSKLSLVNPNHKISVGDTFNVIIQLFDGAGRPRHAGGDDVRVWMVSNNKQVGFSVAGNVLDLSNGTYVATIKALSDGRSIVYVKLAHIREEIATQLRWLRQYRVLFYHEGIFINSKVEEKTVCSFFPMENVKMCNFTTINGGQPWYCKEPSKLKCVDLDRFEESGIRSVPFTDAQKEVIINRSPSFRLLKDKLTVNISQGTLLHPNVKCNRLNKRQTWDTRMPTGYLNRSEWISLKCKNTLSIASLRSCLTNTKLIFMGDSTTRQYYLHLKNKIITDCVQVTEKWRTSKWHESTECLSRALNLSILWNPHELPFSNAKRSGHKINLKSTEEMLDGLDSSQNVVFVIHYYTHFIGEHYSLLIHKLRHLKTAIKKVLIRNKKVKLLIKSPHAFDEFNCRKQLNDIPGPIFIELIKRELQEFQDFIVYVNIWEMSIAFENHKIHPKDTVLWQQLRMLLGYICG